MRLGSKKRYEKPVLQSFGQIQVLTRHFNKDWGNGDPGIFFQSQPTCIVGVDCS
jgi:hypothetical protein